MRIHDRVQIINQDSFNTGDSSLYLAWFKQGTVTFPELKGSGELIMGHRASVCYLGDEGGTVHYSHWGAFDTELLDDITKETPFGSENVEPDFVDEFLSSFDEFDGEIEGELTTAQSDTPVDREPYATVDSIEEWVEKVNALHHECAYLVDMRGEGFEVRAFAPIYWRGVKDMGETGYVLIEAGENAHSMWGSRDAETWEEFLESVVVQFGEPDYVVEP